MLEVATVALHARHFNHQTVAAHFQLTGAASRAEWYALLRFGRLTMQEAHQPTRLETNLAMTRPLTFGVGEELDLESVTADNVFLTPAGGEKKIPVRLQVSEPDHRSLTVHPLEILAVGNYELHITSKVQTTKGRILLGDLALGVVIEKA
jgi:hypothetical protein